MKSEWWMHVLQFSMTVHCCKARLRKFTTWSAASSLTLRFLTSRSSRMRSALCMHWHVDIGAAAALLLPPYVEALELNRSALGERSEALCIRWLSWTTERVRVYVPVFESAGEGRGDWVVGGIVMEKQESAQA